MIAVCAAAAEADLAEYDRTRPFDVKTTGKELREGIEVRDITFAGVSGARTPAYLVSPPPGSARAGVLFVHWYEPESPDSNRTQFLPEAVQLAKLGVTSLLAATMWSEPKWFPSRKRADDVENSIAQLKELRRALDLLLSRPGVDPKRVAYVGHDFGAMFGAVLAGVDRRPCAYALLAGTSTFSHWYLYGPKMPEPDRTQFVEGLKAIDPVTHIGKAAPAPVLLQFGTADKHVPKQRADEFYAAAGEPKKILWYEAGHGLNEQARKDRTAWLIEQLKLSTR
jgi:dienelactone hydrolase